MVEKIEEVLAYSHFTQGKVWIPEIVRKKLGLTSSDKIIWIDVSGEIVIRNARKTRIRAF